MESNNFITDSKSIEESLGLEPKEIVLIEEKPKEVSTKVNDDFDKDFETVRRNLEDLTDKGAIALDEMRTLADQSQSAYGYEVLSTLMKNLAEANRTMIDIHLKKKKMREGVVAPLEGNKTVKNTNFFFGTTSELQDLIKSQQAKNITEDPKE